MKYKILFTYYVSAGDSQPGKSLQGDCSIELLPIDDISKSLKSETIKGCCAVHLAQQGVGNVKSIIPYDIVEASHMPVLEYWRQRCRLVEDILKENPCDPDITENQIAAHNNYRKFIETHKH